MSVDAILSTRDKQSPCFVCFFCIHAQTLNGHHAIPIRSVFVHSDVRDHVCIYLREVEGLSMRYSSKVGEDRYIVRSTATMIYKRPARNITFTRREEHDNKQTKHTHVYAYKEQLGYESGKRGVLLKGKMFPENGRTGSLDQSHQQKIFMARRTSQ